MLPSIRANTFYKLVSAAFIWPVMIGLGMLYVPLDSVVKVFSIGYVLVCVSTPAPSLSARAVIR